MAELIPLEYRIRGARQKLIVRWTVACILTVLVAATSVVAVANWQASQDAKLARLNLEFRSKSELITRANDLKAKRLDLASRMGKIQQLMDDKVILQLMHSVSEGFSANDCLDYLSIDAHGRNGGKSDDPTRFSVRLAGVTASDSTLAELISRLSFPAMSISPESHRETLLDGQVMRFQIQCERTDPRSP